MEQVVNVIEQALNVATQKGAFGLKDASVVNQALELLKTHFEKKDEGEKASEGKPEGPKNSPKK